jgi:serine/threonine protein kinase
MDYDFKSEISIMKELNHPNLLSLLESDENAELVYKNGTTYKTKFMALELAKYGVIFDIIVGGGKFSESLARYYFHQLVDAVEHMHNKGIVHRDIKLENILIDENFDLKLTDFGFSDTEKLSDNPKGSSLYMAPEMHALEKFETIPADMFALGVCLFMMIKAHQPFIEATRYDEYFRVYMTEPKEFWKFHFKKGKKYGHSKSLIKLLNKLFKVDPKSRMTLSEMRKNEWFDGPVPSRAEVIEEMTSRMKSMEESDSQY